MSPQTKHTSKMMGASWVNLILGAVVLLSPFFTTTSTAAFWGAILVGGLIVVLEIYALYAENNAQTKQAAGTETVTLLAGLWLIGFPFFVAASTGYVWTNVIAGIVIAAAAAYNMVVANRERTPRTA